MLALLIVDDNDSDKYVRSIMLEAQAMKLTHTLIAQLGGEARNKTMWPGLSQEVV